MFTFCKGVKRSFKFIAISHNVVAEQQETEMIRAQYDKCKVYDNNTKKNDKKLKEMTT